MNAGTTGWDALIGASGLDRLDARALAEHVSQRPRTWLLAHGEEPVPPEQARVFEALCVRRAAGEPLAYLTGWREFMGHRFDVGPQVLVPRPETEHLVEAALALGDALAHDRALSVLDLGTGSGAIAISLALARPAWRVMATDRSPVALAQAQRNATRLGVDSMHWRLGSWWEALQTGCRTASSSLQDGPFVQDGPFDLILSNPPYLADDDPHLQHAALKHEPLGALVSGPDGLEAIEIIAQGASSWIAPCGWLLLEHGFTQGAAARACLTRAGFGSIKTLPDLAGHDRVTLGRWGPSTPV
jgi:release factor glutamine methyltransferase